MCEIQGQPAMYGLGIRIAFYTQWLGAAIMSHIDEAYLPSIRLHGLLMSWATTLVLIIQAARKRIAGVEIHIVLLLSGGIYMQQVPIYAIRGLTFCHPRCQPLCWSVERASDAMNIVNFILALIIASFGVWFYTTFLPGTGVECHQFGFFFSKVSLSNRLFIAFSVFLYVSMIIVCAGILMNMLGCTVENWKRARRNARRSR